MPAARDVAAEDEPGHDEPLAVIRDDLWQAAFGPFPQPEVTPRRCGPVEQLFDPLAKDVDPLAA